MKVVVTGGSGQLGTVVLRRLFQTRRVKRVVSLDVIAPMVTAAKLDWRIADVRDPDIGRYFEGADVLIHLAFIVTRPAGPRDMEEVNVGGSKNVFDAAAAAGVRRIVYASSVGAYGMVPGHPEPIVESTPRRRVQEIPYCQNKFDVEAYLDDFEREHPGVAVTRFRPVIMIGTRLEHGLGALLGRGLLPDADRAPVPVVWDDDVAAAFVHATLNETRGAFILAADDPLPPRELAERAGLSTLPLPSRLLDALVELKPLVRRLGIDPSWLAARGVRLIASSNKAKAELGWSPSCPTAVDVLSRYRKEAPGRMDRRLALLMRGVGAASRRRPESRIPAEAKRVNLRVHLEVTGRGGGDFDFDIVAGRANITRGVPRPPDSTVTVSRSDLFDALAGRLDTSSMHFTGRVRVRGEPMGAMVFDTLVAGFRRAAEMEGAVGLSARALERWLRRDSRRDPQTNSGAPA